MANSHASSQQTPAALGYTFPAEWERHIATWFSWPRPEGVSFPGKYHTVPENLARIIREITPRERVHINVPNENVEYIARQQLEENRCKLKNIFFHYIRTNDNWCRDHGPAFVVNRAKKKLAIVDWGFNAWGGKYPRWTDDDAVPTHIGEELNLRVFYPRRRRGFASAIAHVEALSVIMEGGSIDVNGQGTLITTTDCLLNPNRNPGMTKAEIERYLKDYYGQKKILWLSGELAGDDTDGHVDDLARFISPTKLVMAVQPDKRDKNAAAINNARKQADNLTDQDGQPLEIIDVPMPSPLVYKGIRLPATYINFYFVNGALLVPTYRDRKNDRKAIAILQSHLPKHKVIGIDCVELIWGRGSIHCMTQQQPKV